MGLFNIFKKSPAPEEKGPGLVYDLLFCDDLNLYRQQVQQQDSYPWNILLKDIDPTGLQGLINEKNTETRVKILAYNSLLANGHQPAVKVLLGVIVEVGLNEGLDVLASYKDGTARYINHSGKIIIWEAANSQSMELTNQLFRDSESIVKKIGPWDQPRRPKPPKGVARITFLVSDGLYFGEAPMKDLFNDPLAGPALNTAAKLMQYLVEYENK